MGFVIFKDNLNETGYMQDGSVSGPDMEYAPDFLALHLSAQYQAERQVGDTILPPREPDWTAVLSDAVHLMQKTRDIRVAVIAAEAAVNRHGLAGFAESMELLSNWMTHHWESVYPTLWVEGDYDPLYRSNAVASLVDPLRLMKQLRQADFLATPIGSISVGGAEKILKGMAFENSVVATKAELMKAMDDSDSKPAVHELLRVSHKSLVAIQSQFETHVPAEFWPDLSALIDLLALLKSIFQTKGGQIVSKVENTIIELKRQNLGGADTNSDFEDNFSGDFLRKITTANEAYEALALVRAYFEKNEPSHPAPLMIKRIERLKGKDFMEMLQDLTPDGLKQLSVLAGLDCGTSS